MTNKISAVEFLNLCSKGNPAKAFELYASPHFKHHNAYFKSDAESLIKGMENSHLQTPDRLFTVLHAVEDGDIVITHSRYQSSPQHSPVAVAHVFRFEDGKIAELWDFGQAVPDNIVNELGMF